MSTESMHEETGAYVLDALPPAERAAFEEHLATCPDCAREVREFAATAALLGAAVAVEPPPGLRDEVLRRIREAPAGADENRAPDAAPGPAARHAARDGRPWARWALAACVAAAAGLGGVAVWQFQEAEGARQEARRAEARATSLTQVLSAPDARLTSGRIADGGTGTVVVSRDRNRAVFVPSGMTAPPPGRVYQLWFADPGKGMRPAGLMDPARPDAPALLAGPVGGATGIGVTLEPAGGSPAPTSDPLVVLALPA
ncbi:anti-sigma factor domain-containing protein [Streptomyces sp. NPDC001568]|uniref:anti-sigma factor n=1 Tax=Streptomyces sp. NPDC001568 TaxID=3364588 RepID=UPI0036B48090